MTRDFSQSRFTHRYSHPERLFRNCRMQQPHFSLQPAFAGRRKFADIQQDRPKPLELPDIVSKKIDLVYSVITSFL